MPATPKRGTNGKFITSDKLEMLDTPIAIPKNMFSKVVVLLVLIIIVSPWLFLLFRNNGIGHMSKKVSDFYDENFSCSNSCLNSCLMNNSTSSSQKQINLNTL